MAANAQVSVETADMVHINSDELHLLGLFDDFQEVTDEKVNPVERLSPDNGASAQNWCWEKVKLCHRVQQLGYPNAWGARIPIYSPWNLELLRGVCWGTIMTLKLWSG